MRSQPAEPDGVSREVREQALQVSSPCRPCCGGARRKPFPSTSSRALGAGGVLGGGAGSGLPGIVLPPIV